MAGHPRAIRDPHVSKTQIQCVQRLDVDAADRPGWTAGKVAGVAVLLKAGNANATIAKLWAHMPKSEGEEKVAGLEANPLDLVPRKQGYYTYLGSQTAPPCNEGVTCSC